MKEKDLPIDRTRHAVYTRKAKKCVLQLLHPLAQEYELAKKENGLLVSVKK